MYGLGYARRRGDANALVDAVGEMGDEDSDEKSEEAGGDVVEHDAGAFGEGFEAADGPGLPDVEEAEEEQVERGVMPVGGGEDEGEELAGYLVDDDVTGIFAAGFAGDDSGGGDADEGYEDCCDEG